MSDRPAPASDAADGEPPLRVLCLHTATQPPLGADTWVHAQIIGGLDRSSHQIHVAHVPTAGGRPTPTAEILAELTGDDGMIPIAVDLGREGWAVQGWRRFTALGIDAVRSVRSVVRLAREIRRRRIQILHTSDRPRDAVVGVAIARLTGIRSLVHLHVVYGPWMSRPLRWAIERADGRIAVSAFAAGKVVEAGIDGPTYVVRNAIDTERWVPGAGRDEARAELDIDPSAPVVVCACRIIPEKGVAELLAAIAEVRRHVPDVQLLVVGRNLSWPDYRKRLDDLMAEHRLDGVVHFLGHRSDVPRMMAAADLFAMPSFEEPFGLVFAEAMAMELPVVAIDNGGTPEVVVNGEHGLLSRPGDHDQLVEHLVTLLQDPDLRAKMGAAGRERALDLFPIERLADQVASTYRQLLIDVDDRAERAR